MVDTETMGVDEDVAAINREHAARHVQRRNMAGFRAPKLDTVRVGVIGMGRGDNHIKAPEGYSDMWWLREYGRRRGITS